MTTARRTAILLAIPVLFLLGLAAAGTIRKATLREEDDRAASFRLREAEGRTDTALQGTKDAPGGPGSDPETDLRSRTGQGRTSMTSQVDPGGSAAGDSQGGEESKGFPPLAWVPGDSWTVESHYRRMSHEGDERWMAQPILWRYSVRGRTNIDGADAYEVQVDAVGGPELPFAPGGALYLSVSDHTVLAVRDRILERGEVRERFLRFDDPTSGALSVLFPTELPPPGTAGRERATTSGALPAHPFRPDPTVEAPAAGDRALDVTFEADGMTIRQRWDASDLRWPLHSRTPSRVSYLRK